MEWLKANWKWVAIGLVVAFAIFFADGSPIFMEGNK